MNLRKLRMKCSSVFMRSSERMTAAPRSTEPITQLVKICCQLNLSSGVVSGNKLGLFAICLIINVSCMKVNQLFTGVESGISTFFLFRGHV